MGRSRVDHTVVKRLLNEKKESIRDSQFFSSRLLAGFFEDIATAQTRRYNYNRRIRVSLKWDPESEELAYTDNSIIVINAGNKMVTVQKTRLERFWVVFGFFAHELGHMLYTNFLVLQTYMNTLQKYKWYPLKPECKTTADKIREKELWEYVKEDEKNLSTFMWVAKNLNNIIEDAYIENRILTSFPGSIGNALDRMREVFFDQLPTVSELRDQEDSGKRHIFESIMQVMLSYAEYGEIKYGTEPLSDVRVQTVFDLIFDIDNAILNRSAKERLMATNTVMLRCWDTIKDFCEFAKERYADQMSAGGSASFEDILSGILSGQVGTTAIGQGKGTPVPEASGGSLPSYTHVKRKKTHEDAKKEDSEGEDGEGEKKDDAEGAGEGDTSSENNGGEKPEPQSGIISDIDRDGKKGGTGSEDGRIGFHQTDDILPPEGDGEVRRNNDYKREMDHNAASDIERILEQMAEADACRELEEKRLEALNTAAQNISYGDAHVGVHINVNRIAEVDSETKEQYNQIAAPLLAISRQLQNTLLRQLKESRRGGKQTGLLMGRRLNSSSLHRNDGRVFYKNALPNETPELAVGLLIDESGSMHSCDRCTYARAAAIILHDFCDKLDIPVMIYGHSTSGPDVELFSYAEFNGYDDNDRYRLMDIGAGGANRDGAALRFVAEQLIKRPEDVKLLMLISDGQPAAYGYSGTAAEEDLRGIKREYQRKGVLFVAAAIGDDKENIERIYGDSFMDITDLNELPTKLTGVVKRHIRVI